MLLRCCHLPSTVEIDLHRKRNKLRAIRVQNHRLDRKLVALATCSQPKKAAKMVTSELRAQAVFTEHLKLQGSSNISEAATSLLRQAAISRNVPPYVALGAALHLEQQEHGNTGVSQPHM